MKTDFAMPINDIGDNLKGLKEVKSAYPVKRSEFMRYAGAVNGVSVDGAFGFVQYNAPTTPKERIILEKSVYEPTSYKIRVADALPRDVEKMVIIQRTSINTYRCTCCSKTNIAFCTAENYYQIHAWLKDQGVACVYGWSVYGK